MKLRSITWPILHQAIEIKSLIESGLEEWDWAKNQQNSGRLNQKILNLKQSFRPFTIQFLTEDPSSVRKAHSAKTIDQEIKYFLAAEEKIRAVEMQVQAIVAAKQAMMATQTQKPIRQKSSPSGK